MERSAELDKVRQLLFRDLPVEEGWARIEEAMKGAADNERFKAIEAAANRDLSTDLADALRRWREQQARGRG